MKSVFVAFDPPMPPTGGGTRTYQMLKTLSQVTSCHLILCFPISNAQLPEDIKRGCIKIDIAQHSFESTFKSSLYNVYDKLRMAFMPFTISALKIVRKADYFLINPCRSQNKLKLWFYNQISLSLFKESKKRYKSGFQMPARTLERVDQYNELEQTLLKSLETADILWIDFSYPLCFFKNIKSIFPGLRIICNAHNIEYLYNKRMAALFTNSVQKDWYDLQSEKLKKIEYEGFIQCDDVLVCSKTDKVTLQQEFPNLKVTVIPNGVDTDYFQPNPAETNLPTLLFTGTMTYVPNQDSVHYFINEIFPLVKKEFPSCVFVVAGFQALKVFPEYARRLDVKLIDSPHDMRPHYNKANIVVVPLRSGSGSRLKILEAMAMGKLVISTPVGAEGIDATNGKHLFLANSVSEFAKIIISLINDKKKADEISSAGLNLARSIYDWKNINSNLENFIKEL